MDILRDKEWEIINNIILSINKSTDLAIIRKDFLTLIRLLITFNKAEFSVDTDDFISTKPITIQIGDKELNRYASMYHKDDSMNLLYHAPNSIVYNDNDVSTTRFLDNDKYYGEYLKLLNTPYLITVVLILNHVFLGCITLYRYEASGKFSEKDAYILEQLKDHVANRLHQLRVTEHGVNLTTASYDFLKEKNISKRELEIIKLLKEGRSNKNIAEILFISELTVKKHISNIYTKLQVSNKVQMLLLLFH